jgi:hypothetical protein
MDNVPFQFFPFLVFGVIGGLIQLVWSIAVLVFLYKIWQKVKHLPG